MRYAIRLDFWSSRVQDLASIGMISMDSRFDPDGNATCSSMLNSRTDLLRELPDSFDSSLRLDTFAAAIVLVSFVILIR